MVARSRSRPRLSRHRWKRRPRLGEALTVIAVLALGASACGRPEGQTVNAERQGPRIVERGPDAQADAADGGPRRELHVIGLVFQIPESWEEAQADRPSELQFRRAAIQGDRFGAELQVRASGGGRAGDVEAAMRHWISRMQTAAGEDASRVAIRSRLTIETGVTIHFVEIDGIYLRSMGGGPMTGGRTKALHDYRLVGSIVLADRGTALFEIVGPRETARTMERELRDMLGAMEMTHAQSGTSSNTVPTRDGATPRR